MIHRKWSLFQSLTILFFYYWNQRSWSRERFLKNPLLSTVAEWNVIKKSWTNTKEGKKISLKKEVYENKNKDLLLRVGNIFMPSIKLCDSWTWHGEHLSKDGQWNLKLDWKHLLYLIQRLKIFQKKKNQLFWDICGYL